MRKVIACNENWLFYKGDLELTDMVSMDQWENVTLPHTWNALDGQDGGNDYYQGISWYCHEFERSADNRELYLKIGAASKMAKVWCNDQFVGEHRGGFSSFVMDLTEVSKVGKNKLLIQVDNSLSLPIYPMSADFTFFGGLYRGAELISFSEKTHFDLSTFGTDGIFITPDMDGTVRADFYYQGAGKAVVEILDAEGNSASERAEISLAAAEKSQKASAELNVSEVHAWNGIEDPYQYTLKAEIYVDGADGKEQMADGISVLFGFREFRVDAASGFYLNQKSYPLHGVCRHQDRENMGWALTEKEHDEDISIIQEMGANTLRLAHYQNAPYFYDLCDKAGIIVWAEIPFISMYDPREEADENLRQQLRELICQNYNHPSICFWGIANEIGIGGESESMYDMVRELHQTAKEMDQMRLTVIANVGMTKTSSPLFHITDLVSYNEYMGWYEGKYTDHGSFCDARHGEIPDIPLAISEYGADCLVSWHSEDPKIKDYTEEYQALLHEHAEADFSERPYLWATWLWNMFDFAADARDEGGCKGRNNKGLVTYDRKIKKQAFYYYKAKWSKEPFVYLCGKRFTKHLEDGVNVKVYSNLPEVELFVNGISAGRKRGEAVFVFEDIALADGMNMLEARGADGQTDSVQWEKTEEFPSEYIYKQEKQVSEAVTQWFAHICPEGTERKEELKAKEGYLSVFDPLEEVYKYKEGYEVIQELVRQPLSLVNPQMADRMKSGGAMSFSSIWNHIHKMLPDHLIYIVNDKLSEIPK